MERKNILFVSAECADFIKMGGLGDVSAALPRALRSISNIRVLIPGYSAVLNSGVWEHVCAVPAHANLPVSSIIKTTRPDGLVVYAVRCPMLFECGGTPYEMSPGKPWENMHIRFGLLSYVAAYMSDYPVDFTVDVLHCNDWHTALAPAYLQRQHHCVLTIHNLAYQGVFPMEYINQLGLQWRPELECWGQLSFMHAGLCLASVINTVSPHYADQITTTEYGCGLEHLLQQRFKKGQLVGILNGAGDINPQIDPYISHTFNAQSLNIKNDNRSVVQKSLGLRQSNAPMFSVVSRMVHQKGVDLTCEVTKNIVHAGGQIAFIGQGDPDLENLVKSLSRTYPHAVGAFIGFEEGLSRQIMAGSDFLLMPSRFEPCGLSQMYAQKFGCLPIAHCTGGLKDTIADNETGFLFAAATSDYLKHTLIRAFRTFKNPSLLTAMKQNAMLKDVSWKPVAEKYKDLYACN